MLGHRKRILASLKHFAEAERRSHFTSSALSKTLGEQRSQGQADTDVRFMHMCLDMHI